MEAYGFEFLNMQPNCSLSDDVVGLHCSLAHMFTFPLHLQYQVARYDGQTHIPLIIGYPKICLHHPLIASSSVSPKPSVPVLQGRYANRSFQYSYLGIEQSVTFPYDYQPLTNTNTVTGIDNGEQITLYMPVGNMHHYPFVFFVTFTVILLSTASLLLHLCCTAPPIETPITSTSYALSKQKRLVDKQAMDKKVA